ncbi:two-component sensor histidine kinase [Halarcobacter mediterraneus]|uniref:histidine kinase n=1 Tax=Halarcobacter mediterraneus TaxID=2023153 RepID=A0A4Q1ATU0_9BACT|nr:HAMP domain-containing sensor histidine kinase [Halarcobacter mediterraneus]RXK13193.1 two-component sensor histidine kinase [Halarcobacter mediterraneus]
MTQAKSIYKQFYQKLILATSLFIIILSFIFYGYTKSTIYEELKESLLSDAELIFKISQNADANSKNFNIITHKGINVDMVTLKHFPEIPYTTFKINDDHFMQILYPFNKDKKQYIKIVKNINSSIQMLTKIFNNILLISFGGLIMVVLYAFTVSKTLLRPIIQITKNLSNMDENYLTQINKKNLPIEFHPLANSINSLTTRIETNIKFKKELFIGVAHELKTPLAVMKLKNEVTLMKDREPQKYKDTLKLTIEQINDMNKMISSILDIGRAEGAQFEKPEEIDLVQYMQRKTNDYRMLSAKKKIVLTFFSNVNHHKVNIQATLLNQIIQNFVQNAIKFTPDDKAIAIRLEKTKKTTTITITDDGSGIDESIDLFAPFKRMGEESGAGLGLFLAKNAADALGAEVSLKNREDGKTGCVATLILNNKTSQKKD